MSLPPLHYDSVKYENGRGGSGNINKEEVPVHAIAYAVDDPEEPNLFIAERVPSALLCTAGGGGGGWGRAVKLSRTEQKERSCFARPSRRRAGPTARNLLPKR